MLLTDDGSCQMPTAKPNAMLEQRTAQRQRDRMHSAVLHEEAQAMCAQRDAIEARLSAADAKTKAGAASHCTLCSQESIVTS